MRVVIQQKPWGCELLFAHTEHYAAKILCIAAGERLSLQHHVIKDETLFLLEGEVLLDLELGAERYARGPMAKDRSYHVPAGRKHRLSALTDARVLEVSTPDLHDVVRWEDDYERAPTEIGAATRAANACPGGLTG